MKLKINQHLACEFEIKDLGRFKEVAYSRMGICLS